MKKLTFLKSLLLGGMLFTATALFSQVNISAGNTVTENFDGIGTTATATLPTGWKADKNTTVRSVGSYSAAVNKTELSAGNNMSSTAGNGIYNYGAGDPTTATDRAVGGISSGSASKSVNVYVQLTNNGSTSINNFTISFDVEKFRKGSNAAGFTIQMYYSTDGSTWTSAGDDFKGSFTADTDNSGFASAPGATASVTGKTLSQSLDAGASLYLAWNYSVTSGTTTSNAQALGIDNVSIKANGTSNPVAATPEFSPAAGTYTSAQSVTISCATSGASIYYTTDGSDPDNTKTPYTGAISVTSTTTIKARAYADGYDPSAIASATYTINAAPTITVTEVTLPAFSATAGSSQNQNITVSGTNLTGNITLALSGTDADVFSLSEYTITPTAGSVTDKVITITYAPTAPGSHSATLTLSSSGATDVTRDLTGTATLAKPTVNTASNIGKTALTLNWNAVTGATSYEVNVYTKTTGTVTATDLFISEYGEGSSNNKYIEIFNGTGANVDLSNYVLKQAYNGGGWDVDITRSLPLTGTLSNGSVYVIANDGASETVKAKANLIVPYSTTEQGGRVVTFTGNDAIGLFKNGSLIDLFGNPLSNADISVAGYTTWASDHTLVRKSSVTSPTSDWSLSSGTDETTSQWLGYASDTWTYLGSHTMDGAGTINNPISGSPFTTTETSLQVSDLTAATTYYYTVTAKNGTYVSPASDEASASTLGTATPNVSVQGIFVRNGKVIVTAPAAGESIEIFNAVGQRLVSTLSTAGENEIAVPAKGILLVKAGSQVTKVMMP